MNTSDLISAGEATQTLLVVEDEILIRFHICSYLRECGFKVIEAANSDEALTVLQDSDIPVDIVLSDAEIPGRMDGFGLSQWLRAHKPEISVILVGSPGRAVEAAADLCEAGPVMARPYEPAILLDRIKRILGERHRHPESDDGQQRGRTMTGPSDRACP
jgi:DNA-binding response OmpR family regulator